VGTESDIKKAGIQISERRHQQMKSAAALRMKGPGQYMNQGEAYSEAATIWLSISPELHESVRKRSGSIANAVVEGLRLWLENMPGGMPNGALKTNVKNLSSGIANQAGIDRMASPRENEQQKRLEELLHIVQRSGDIYAIATVSTVLEAIAGQIPAAMKDQGTVDDAINATATSARNAAEQSDRGSGNAPGSDSEIKQESARIRAALDRIEDQPRKNNPRVPRNRRGA
jgi:hypothetical protein